MSQKLVAYYRVSTADQGESGLGLEAQRTSVIRFLKPGQELIREFVEVESGKKNNRQILQDALIYSKLKGATLVIAKLDRLARNAAFIHSLRDSKAEFVCADMPEANTLTIGIFASLAQHEREVISDRTKKALAELKARGVILGKPENLTREAALKGAASRVKRARENPNNRRAAAMIKSLAAAGKNCSDIARQLNAAGFTTSTGKQFQAVQVQRLQRDH